MGILVINVNGFGIVFELFFEFDALIVLQGK